MMSTGKLALSFLLGHQLYGVNPYKSRGDRGNAPGARFLGARGIADSSVYRSVASTALLILATI